MVNAVDLKHKNVMEKKWRRQPDCFFLNKLQQINFGILKEKIMMRALSIHDKMALVLGL